MWIYASSGKKSRDLRSCKNHSWLTQSKARMCRVGGISEGSRWCKAPRGAKLQAVQDLLQSAINLDAAEAPICIFCCRATACWLSTMAPARFGLGGLRSWGSAHHIVQVGPLELKNSPPAEFLCNLRPYYYLINLSSPPQVRINRIQPVDRLLIQQGSMNHHEHPNQQQHGEIILQTRHSTNISSAPHGTGFVLSGSCSPSRDLTKCDSTESKAFGIRRGGWKDEAGRTKEASGSLF